MLKKTQGNMYEFITHTKNFIKGSCDHNCKYCYMKRWGKQNPIRLDNKELNENLGKDNFIFVGSSTDMFAVDVQSEWIKEVLIKCNEYDKNKYMFQSKNPKRFYEFIDLFPKDTILCTTIESNIDHAVSSAPEIEDRVKAMENIKTFDKMITIEPILDFTHTELIKMIKRINPRYVNIGADSQNHYLPEPKKDKVMKLINHLEIMDSIKLTIKPNLRRLL